MWPCSVCTFWNIRTENELQTKFGSILQWTDNPNQATGTGTTRVAPFLSVLGYVRWCVHTIPVSTQIRKKNALKDWAEVYNWSFARVKYVYQPLIWQYFTHASGIFSRKVPPPQVWVLIGKERENWRTHSADEDLSASPRPRSPVVTTRHYRWLSPRPTLRCWRHSPLARCLASPFARLLSPLATTAVLRSSTLSESQRCRVTLGGRGELTPAHREYKWNINE